MLGSRPEAPESPLLGPLAVTEGLVVPAPCGSRDLGRGDSEAGGVQFAPFSDTVTRLHVLFLLLEGGNGRLLRGCDPLPYPVSGSFDAILRLRGGGSRFVGRVVAGLAGVGVGGSGSRGGLNPCYGVVLYSGSVDIVTRGRRSEGVGGVVFSCAGGVETR